MQYATDGICGEEIDLFPAEPGNIVVTCARPPHSTRAWHRNEDNTFQWRRQPKRRSE